MAFDTRPPGYSTEAMAANSRDEVIHHRQVTCVLRLMEGAGYRTGQMGSRHCQPGATLSERVGSVRSWLEGSAARTALRAGRGAQVATAGSNRSTTHRTASETPLATQLINAVLVAEKVCSSLQSARDELGVPERTICYWHTEFTFDEAKVTEWMTTMRLAKKQITSDGLRKFFRKPKDYDPEQPDFDPPEIWHAPQEEWIKTASGTRFWRPDRILESISVRGAY